MDPQDENPRRSRTRLEVVLDFMARIRWIWGPLLVLLAIGLLAGTIPVPIQIGPATRTIVASTIVTLLVGYIPAKNLLKRLYRPRLDTIVTVNPTDPDRVIDAYTIAPETVRDELEVTEGQLETQPGARGTVHIARTFDPDTMEATGTWLGELSDIELMDARENIEAQRLRNNKAAQAGIISLARMDTIEDQVKSAYFMNLVKDGLTFTAYDQDALLDPISDQIEGIDPAQDPGTDLDELIQDKLGDDLPTQQDQGGDQGGD